MGKNVTIVQIAKECGVSVATVSRVLNGTAPVSEEKRRRIQETMARHHYSPNALARGLVNRQSMTLGVLIPDITNPYFSSMFTEFEAAAQAAGYSLLLCNTAFSANRAGERTKRETDYFRTMVDKRVDGVLIVGGQADLNAPGESYRAALRELADTLPVVVLGNPIPGINCRFLQRERGRGVFASVSYLSDLGHKRIAFVGGEDGVDITLERLAAYRQALAVLGLPEDEDIDSNTVNGLVQEKTCHLPKVGDHFQLNDYEGVVTRTARRRVTEVRLTPAESVDAEEKDDEKEKRFPRLSARENR